MTSQCLCHKITVLTETLKNDLDGLNACTKLTFTDIHKLTELCLSKSYVLYENKMRLLENAGPVGYGSIIWKLFTTSVTQNNGRSPYYANTTEDI